MMGWLPAVLVLGGLIFLHELGHFVLARACGVEVEEFSLGIGPRIAGVRRGPTLYALRLLPILGYVRMAGMYPLPGPAQQEGDAEGDEVPAEVDRSRDANARGVGFGSRPLWQRVAIIAAGPVANFVVAFVLFVAVLGGLGVPVAPTMQIRTVEAGMPAARAGLRPGDVVGAVDGAAVHSWTGLRQAIIGATQSHPGAPLTLTVRRDGQSRTISVVPANTSAGPVIGVIPVVRTARLPLWRAIWLSAEQTALAVYQSVAGLVGLAAAALRHQNSQVQLMGPIGIGDQIDQASQAGGVTLLLLAGALSANLGLLNLLPIPALDGGRLVFLALEWVRGGRAVDPAKEGMVHFIGLALLMALVLIVSIHDISQLG